MSNCCICLENIPNQPIVLPNCTHSFCFTCIAKWAEVNNTCPLCKSSFTELVLKIKSTPEPLDSSNSTEHTDQLNPEQQLAFDLMCKGSNVFLTGAGGCGKSFTISKYYDYAVEKYGSECVYKTSSTGVSAILIGGSTLHSWAGIYLGEGTVHELFTKMRFPIRKRWAKTKVLFIDEISMITPILFDKLESLARMIRRNLLPFGGLQLIISGDFFQLPAVKSDKYCFESESWHRVVQHTVSLTTIVRQKDPKFQELLNEVRFGEISDENSEILKSRVGAKLINDYGIEPTVLYPKKINVNDINNKKLQLILKKEKEHIFIAKYIISYNNTSQPKNKIIERFQKIEDRTLDIITLAKGAQVVYKFNVDVSSGIANGTRGIVEDFLPETGSKSEEKYPLITLLSGRKHLAVPVDFEYEIDKEYKIVKKQVPLKLAWASTIHSCQGSTLDYVKADIGSSIFECGQAYVALSRVRSLEGLTLTSYDPNSIAANPKVLEKYGPKY